MQNITNNRVAKYSTDQPSLNIYTNGGIPTPTGEGIQTKPYFSGKNYTNNNYSVYYFISLIVIVVLISLSIILFKKGGKKMEKTEKIQIFVKKNTKAIIMTLITIIILFLIGFSFYWFGVRPAEIRKFCTNKMLDIVKKTNSPLTRTESADYFYRVCLQQNGLNE